MKILKFSKLNQHDMFLKIQFIKIGTTYSQYFFFKGQRDFIKKNTIRYARNNTKHETHNTPFNTILVNNPKLLDLIPEHETICICPF
jgi:hypothetical protein